MNNLTIGVSNNWGQSITIGVRVDLTDSRKSTAISNTFGWGHRRHRAERLFRRGPRIDNLHLAAESTQNPNETTPMTTALLTEPTRRDFLFVATAAAAAVGAGSTLIPLVAQMNPDASEIAAGAPVEVDLTPIAEGQVIKVIWRRKVIFISHRTGKSIDDARSVELSQLIDPQPDHARVKAGHEQWLVVSGTCTHAGCVPIVNRDDVGGWSCPCHGSQYDSSGRVRRRPASANLPVPPYVFVNDSKIRIG